MALVCIVLACIALAIERFEANLYNQGVIVLSCGFLAVVATVAAVGLTKMRCAAPATSVPRQWLRRVPPPPPPPLTSLWPLVPAGL